MTQTVHILRKDLRRLRWVIGAWLAVITLRMLIDTVGADVALTGLGPQIGISELSQLTSMMYLLLLALIISMVVHDEPLVGRDAFWMTRPIVPGALMNAKLTFVAIFLLLAPVAAHVIVAARFGIRGGDIARAVLVLALNQSVFVALLMAVAVLTPSLVRYVLAIVGVIAAFVIATASVVFVAMFLVREASEEGGAVFPDPTRAVIAAMLMVLIALVVIVYQYRHRHVGRALTIAAVGVVALLAIPDRWPWSFAAALTPEMAPAPQNSEAIAVSLDGANVRVADNYEAMLRRRTATRKYLSARATVSGVPSEFVFRTAVPRSRLELAGGVVLQNNRRSAYATGQLFGSISGRTATVEAALGGIRLLTGSDTTERALPQQWPTVLRVDESDYMRYRRDAGRLTADIDVFFERAIVRGTLPLEDNAAARIGNARVSIVAVIRRATGCIVLLRSAFVESLFTQPRGHPDVMYVLRNASRGEAAAGDSHPFFEEGFSVGRFFVPNPRFGGRGFVLEQYEIQFPSNRSPETSAVDLDQSWLAGAELVILDMISAGRISRTVTVDEFRMAP